MVLLVDYDEDGNETTKDPIIIMMVNKKLPIQILYGKHYLPHGLMIGLLGGDIDMATAGNLADGVIGGWNWVDNNGNGKIDVDEDEMVESDGGKYNEYGQKEVGSGDDRSIK